MTGPQHLQEQRSSQAGLGAPLAPGIRDASCEDLAVISHGSRQMEQQGSSCEGICRKQRHTLCQGPGKSAVLEGNVLEQHCPPRPAKPLKQTSINNSKISLF